MGAVQSLQEGVFTVVAEFSPHSREDVVQVAEVAKGLPELARKFAPQGIAFPAISLTQNPGGSLTYDHLGALAILRENGLPESIEVIPHVTGKDMNADAIRTLLTGLVENGVTTILALTGDKPTGAKGVFEVDSLGLLQLVKEFNASLLRKAKSVEELAAISVIDAGGAVSPFKYTPGSLAMQYIKAAKKVRQRAAFLVCQSGWDSERSERLIDELGDVGAPILGNVLVLNAVAARHMQGLPGCVVTDDLVKRLVDDQPADILARAGQQMAMFRQLGYAGVDLGKPGDFKSIEEIDSIVETAVSIDDWREFRGNLTFPAHEHAKPAKKVRETVAFSNLAHSLVMEETGALHGVAKAVLTPFEHSAEREGALYRFFNCLEGFGKGMLYGCEHCGDCFLAENKYACTKGGCAKGLGNPPCGDASPEGMCGSNPNKVCVGETVYSRLLHYGDLEAFREAALPQRDPALQNSSSLLNHFFGRDHATHKNPLEGSGLIQIAELIHASIPLAGAALQTLLDLGEEAFTTPNRGLFVLEDLIHSQAMQGGDYIDLNIDALNAADAPAFMRQVVGQVFRHGEGVPPCVDSSDLNVLCAGLEQWFEMEGARSPLVNSIPYVERDKCQSILALRKQHAFGIVCLLVGPEGPLKSTDEMYGAAKEMFAIAREAGFAPNEIFFDAVTLGIASDGCIDGMGNFKPSHTHNSFHAIQKIRQDPEMEGVHAALGVSNWVYGATKRRIGHIRAFIAVAQKYGLDTAIVDVSKRFGITPAAPELMGFVESFVSLDGADDAMMTYSTAMQEARAANWI